MNDKFAVSDVFINAAVPLAPKDAVAAIILNEKNHVLLQLRDNKEDIFFPNHWGCFGGAIEPGETPYDTVIRELGEELGMTFDPALIEQFIRISFSPKATSKRDVERYFFIVRMRSDAMKEIRLGEGRAFDFFAYGDAMRLANITPYDKFALWLYFNQNRLTE